MSAKFRLQQLREFRTSRNNVLNVDAIRFSFEHSLPTWPMWKPEEQADAIKKKRDEHLPEMQKRLSHIQQEIASEMKDAKAGIDRLKYPLRSSKDIELVTLGTQRQTNALLFLNGNPSEERIAKEIREAFQRGEVDYGFSLFENCLNDIRRDLAGKVILTEPRKWLQAELETIYGSFPGKAKLDELESELKGFATAELIAQDFAGQEEAGAASLVSVELFPFLSENERLESMQQVAARGNLMESVSFKRRAFETIA